jgi:hypothetical protein
MMPASLRAFMAHLIDYAGLFPPAALPLEPAVATFLAYRRGPDVGMLGHFICPAARLAELGRLVPPAEGPIPVAALGRKCAADEFRAGLADDLAHVAAARAQYRDALAPRVLELPLPPGVPDAAVLAHVAESTHAAHLRVFCEVVAPLDADWAGAVARAAAALRAHNASGAPPLGLKLRTGGVTADAFPAPEQLAAAIVAARDAGLAVKFTAGLHHPFRQHRPEVGAPMHGFVNVFAAGLLAHARGLDAPAVARILRDEEPSAFSFGPAGLAWGDLSVPVDEIARLRRSALISYGSCSFDEPRDDLRALGLLA